MKATTKYALVVVPL